MKADVQSQVSALKGIKEIYEDIDTVDVRTAVQKGIYEDEVSQARDLLNGDQVIPAVAVTRIILKKFLESLCEKNDIKTKNGINDILIQLKEKDIISKIEWREMQKWNDVCNVARYEEKEIDHGEIKDTIDKVEDFTDRLEFQT